VSLGINSCIISVSCRLYCTPSSLY